MKEKAIQAVGDIAPHVVTLTVNELVQCGLVNACLLGDAVNAERAVAHRLSEVLRETLVSVYGIAFPYRLFQSDIQCSAISFQFTSESAADKRSLYKLGCFSGAASVIASLS